MACDQQTLLLISTYADGEASPAEAAEARSHLDQCAECRKLVEDWQSQRTMFEWAYSIPLPENDAIFEEAAMSEIERTPGRGFRFGLGWNLRMAGAFAAIVIVGWVIYHFATLPPMLGNRLATGVKPERVRVASNIELKVGPETKITRIDARSIRLDRGWVSAKVRHGSGFRILTPRIEVTDQGTRFTVTSGPENDYVIVEEGAVRVSKGRWQESVCRGGVLVAQDRGQPSVLSLPQDTKEDQGTPSESISVLVAKEGKAFIPVGGDQLDWNDGLKRLASRFPDIVLDGGWQSSTSGTEAPPEYRYQASKCKYLRRNIREHSLDIARAASGGRVDSGGWEIPICVLMTDGLNSSPELPSDIYYLRLVSESGYLKWRLSGSSGKDADFPVTFLKRASDTLGQTGLDFETSHSAAIAGTGPYELGVRMMDWPGQLKPQLQLDLRGVSNSVMTMQRKTIFASIASLFPSVGGFGESQQILLYLDHERKHKLMIAQYSDVGERLERLRNQMRLGRGGSADFAVIAADEPFLEPPAPAGTYLLRIVCPISSKTAHWEVVNEDSWKLPLPRTKDVFSSSWSTVVDLPGQRKYLDFGYNTGPASRGTFPFRFQLGDGMMVDGSQNRFVDGYIRVRQP